jgi:hypothetical protein
LIKYHAEKNYVYWQDVDDMLKGSRTCGKHLKQQFDGNGQVSSLLYWYRVLLDEAIKRFEKILIEQKRERIIRNDGTYRWVWRNAA